MLFALAVTIYMRSGRRTRPLTALVRNQPVTYSTKAPVRQRSGKGPYGVGWGTLKSPTGAQLVVHTEGLEVSLAPPFNRVMSSGCCMKAVGAVMWVDRQCWGGSSIGQRDCIRLSGHDGDAPVEVAVVPDQPLEEVWNALVRVGVSPAAADPRWVTT